MAGALSIDDPPYSRLFVVVGRNTSAEYLREVFSSLGNVSFVKYLREKGVAYVKYDRASSAALAIETLHEVTLNDGQGPRLKVILADSPHTRTLSALQPRRPLDDDTPGDPDNTPARSRLFMVVPKSADGSLIEADMARFSGMQYCKTDLIATKGIVFVKYAKSSAACLAMETIQETGMVAGYKVKVMLAEPKSRRGSPEGLGPYGLGLPGGPGTRGAGAPLAPQGLLAAGAMLPPGAGYAGPAGGASLLGSLAAPGLMGQGLGLPDYSGLGSVGAIGSGAAFGSMPSLAAAAAMGRGASMSPPLPPLDPAAALTNQVSLASFGLGGLGNGMGFGGLGAGLPPPMGSVGSGAGLLHPMTPSAASASSSTTQLSRTRLFVVVHKSIGDEALGRMFRAFPGMEYCDLKRDRGTGRSKGYAYVNYTSPESAAAAQAQLNGIDFPPGSGCRLKVMFAEPQGIRPVRSGSDAGSDPGQATSAYLSSPSNCEPAGGAGAGGAVGGMQQLMASPGDTTASLQLHTPLTGESGVLPSGSGSGYALSGEPSPASLRGGAGGMGAEGGAGAGSGVGSGIGPSPHSSPLRPGGMGGLLDAADVAAVQSSLASISLAAAAQAAAEQNGGGPLGGGLAAGPPSAHQSPISTGVRSAHSPLSVAGGGGEGVGGAATPPSWHGRSDTLSPADPPLAGRPPGSASVSPIKPQALLASPSPPGHPPAAGGTASAAASPQAAVGAASPARAPYPPPADETVVYSALSRPLPDYALSHVFSQVGSVEYVRVLADERVALVKYCSPEGARAAVCSLNGTEVLGEVLHVRHTPPLPLHARCSP